MNILKSSFLFICLFSNILLADDTISNLEKQLPFLSDDKKIEALKDLAKYYAKTSPKKSIEYGDQALVLVENSSDDKATATILTYLGEAHQHLGDYEKALELHFKSLQIRQKQTDKGEMAESFTNICIAQWRLSDYDKALEYCGKSSKIYEELGDQPGLAKAWHNLGIAYDWLGYHDKALTFLQKALAIREKLGNQEDIADSLTNIGIVYHFSNDLEKALEYYLKSLDILEKVGDDRGLAKVLNNLGFVYKDRDSKDYEKAVEYYLSSLKMWQKIGDNFEVVNVSNNLGQAYTRLRKYEIAYFYLSSALRFAEEKGVKTKEFFRENYEFFSDLYEAQRDYQKALEFIKKSAAMKDSIFREMLEKVTDFQTKYETEKKQRQIEKLERESDFKELELARQKLQRNSLLGGFALVLMLMFVLYHLYRMSKKANLRLREAHRVIRLEKDKSDKLLLNILPYRVAHDLKEKQCTTPESFENVTVYFSDIVGFTQLSAQLEPKALIDELNEIFTAFDNIVEKHQCERIKTIGDAYLCVCGMPDGNPNHAENMVQSAIEIITYLRHRNQLKSVKWEIRVGIHTGRVVGGVVGVKKYIYDVFGDTINTASRMESLSEPMKINMSEVTYELVKGKFEVVERGTLPVKGKGEMKMFFVEC